MYLSKKGMKESSCRICSINKHGCVKEDTQKKSKGDTWLCLDCTKFMDDTMKKYPDIFDELKANLVIKGTKRKRTESVLHNLTDTKSVETPNNRSTKTPSTLSLLGITIENEDVKSLEEGHWLSDTIIALWFEYLKVWKYGNNKDILFIQPSTTQLLKQGSTDDFDMILQPLNIWQKKYLLMAVNDNKLDQSGGQHWSLLVYKIMENTWYHSDSLNISNLKEARFLVRTLQE